MTDNTSGILIVDKPQDMTSAGVIRRIKKISGINKIGHTGTLDPMATGVMICTINRATRLSRFFLESPKKYTAVLGLGVETDTLDATGNVLATRPVDRISEQAVIEACKAFEGEIEQIPPAYSALKHKGVPLYTYARKGAPVVKPPRNVVISSIKIHDIDFPDIRLDIECSSGTYIRSLCADIGEMLGCGGHMKALRRTGCGGFNISDAVSLEEIESHSTLADIRQLIPMADALPEMATLVAKADVKEIIKYGKPLVIRDLKDIETDFARGAETADARFIKVIDAENRLLAVVRPDEARERYNYCCVFYNP
jgi:tRNA pseudouridine55 synthase